MLWLRRWGNQANANNAQFTMMQYTANGMAVPSNAQEMQVQGTHLRTLSAAEKHQLNEEFRRIRLMQMDQCIRLETVMVREMKGVPTLRVPQLNANHVKAKKRMNAGHVEQLRNLLHSVQGLLQPPHPAH